MNQWRVRRPKDLTAFKNKMLKKEGEERKGGLYIGKMTGNVKIGMALFLFVF